MRRDDGGARRRAPERGRDALGRDEHDERGLDGRAELLEHELDEPGQHLDNERGEYHQRGLDDGCRLHHERGLDNERGEHDGGQ